MKISRKSKVESRTLVIPAKQSVREFRLCEERRDEAISILYINNEIASLRSQRRSTFLYSRTDWKAGIQVFISFPCSSVGMHCDIKSFYQDYKLKVQFPGYEELVNKFLNFNLESLNDISDKIVNKFDNGKLFPPYVPFVGNNYQSTKILIYAMAQNLDRNFVSKTYGSNFSEKQLVERLKYGWNPVDFIEKEAKFYNIKIEPYRVGILPSLAGIYSQIHLRMKFETLDEVHNNIAVSNYYKFNYHQEKTKKQKSKDINPNSLNPEDYKEYFRINDELVKLELDTLKPELIMLFNGRHKEEIGKIHEDFQLRLKELMIHHGFDGEQKVV